MPVIAVDDKDFQDPATLPHDSLGNDVIICAIVCFIIAAVSVGLRVYTRTKLVNAFAASDWFLFASLIGSGLHSAFFVREAVEGLGSHVWDFDVEANYFRLQQSAWFAILWYNVTLLLIKVSFLLLYIKIFTYQRAGVICKAILGLAIIAGMFGIVLALTDCIPLRAFWDKSITNAYCHSNDLWWINTALHIVTDFLIWSVPLPQIWRMTIPRPQKVTLISLFSLGFIVALISIVRTVFLNDLFRKADPDFAWVGARFAFLNLIEVNAGITVACLLTLKPLAHRLFPNLLKANNSQGLLGDTPPTIGTRPPPCGAHRAHRSWGAHKAEIETWEIVPTDLEAGTTSSMRAS